MSILGIVAGVAGIGGIGFFALRMFAPGILASITAVLAKIPPKGWIAIGAAALLVVGYFVHQHKAHAAIAAAYAKGSSDRDAAWQKRLDAERAAGQQWKAKAEANAAKISQEERAHHEDDLNVIAARADAQRVRGPGKAAAPSCGGHGDAARLPASPGGHVAAGVAPDATMAGLSPDQGLAIVRWDDLTSFAASHDAERAENLSWRSWYARQAEANRVARETPPKP
jgi:hypothetical protein